MLNRKYRFKYLSQIVLRKMYFIIKTRITDIHKSCMVHNYTACSYCTFIESKPKMDKVKTLYIFYKNITLKKKTPQFSENLFLVN